MSALYNEIDPYAAAWLRNLIAEGHIATGVVDERSIEDLEPDYVGSFTQFHAFAGLGGWSLALRMAGVSDHARLWTGSCPCQPFSAAGKGGGFADERHLWPAMQWLVGECRPDVVIGEQVEGPASREWVDLVATDLEGCGYAFGTSVFPAAGVGSPQIRHRTYWLAHAHKARRGVEWSAGLSGLADASHGHDIDGRGWTGGVGHASAAGLSLRECPALEPTGWRIEGRTTEQPSLPFGRMAGADERERGRLAVSEGEPDRQARGRQQGDGGLAGDCEAGGVADAEDLGSRREYRELGASEVNGIREVSGQGLGLAELGFSGADGRPGPVNGFWRASDWLYCRDDKWRPVEPGSFPLASGVPARVGKLRACGNAICVPQAVAFVEAVVAAQGVALPTDVRQTQEVV